MIFIFVAVFSFGFAAVDDVRKEKRERLLSRSAEARGVAYRATNHNHMMHHQHQHDDDHDGSSLSQAGGAQAAGMGMGMGGMRQRTEYGGHSGAGSPGSHGKASPDGGVQVSAAAAIELFAVGGGGGGGGGGGDGSPPRRHS
jgi:hypothetical protein